MNLFHLRYFVKLAHVQHYSKAAEQLCISQPSLSYAISQLEKELGVPLFEKSGRNTTLTRFGEEFLFSVEQSLETLDTEVASLQRIARGQGVIRLGLLRTLGISFVPALVSEFLSANPGLDINFTFHTDVTQQLLTDLSNRKYDLVFSSKPPSDSALSYSPIAKQELVLIVPKNHPLADRHVVELSETLPYPQVCFSTVSGMRSVVDNLFAKIQSTPKIAYETEEDQVIAGLVAQGFGIAIVPDMELLLKLDVTILHISPTDVERHFYLVNNPKVYLSPAAQHFQQFVLDRQSL